MEANLCCKAFQHRGVASDRQVKVLYIVTAYPRSRGDVITPWLVETIQRLRARGVDVEVLAPSYRGLPDQVIDGVRVHRFRYAPRAWETLTHDQTAPDRIREQPRFLALVPSYVAAGSLAAIRLARTGEYRLIHAFWPVPHGLFGMAAKRVTGIPLISTFFGVELTWVQSQLSFLRPLLRRIVKSSDAVTVISSYTARAVRQLVGEVRLETIPFGATVDVGTEPLPDSRTSGVLRLLFTGRLVERKGVRILLEALAMIQDEPAVMLKVVGDGPLRSELQTYAGELGIASRVEFTGFVSSSELARHFRQCDAFVLPAVQDTKGDVEGLGVVLIEALTYGKPVIASASGGIVDVVQDGQTGLLVPPGDVAALAAAVVKYRDNPELARSLAVAGRDFVAQKFSWPAIIDRLASLYHQIGHSAKEKR